jgi:hypothetical protein
MAEPSGPLVHARALLDNAEISSDDRSAFLASLTAALRDGDPELIVSPSQRQPWARALLVVADFLIPPPVAPPPADTAIANGAEEGEEEEEFLLTPSEFELWEKFKSGTIADAAPIAEPLTEDSAPLEKLPDSEPEPPTKPAAADGFEDFVIDKVETPQ